MVGRESQSRLPWFIEEEEADLALLINCRRSWGCWERWMVVRKGWESCRWVLGQGDVRRGGDEVMNWNRPRWKHCWSMQCEIRFPSSSRAGTLQSTRSPHFLPRVNQWQWNECDYRACKVPFVGHWCMV